jgi:hypothetical protein
LTYAVSDPCIKVEKLMIQQDTIVLSGQAGHAMSTSQATLFIYSDKLKDDLLATINIEIYARQVIYTKTKYGFKTAHSLSMPIQKSRRVMFYSNKPKEVF